MTSNVLKVRKTEIKQTNKNCLNCISFFKTLLMRNVSRQVFAGSSFLDVFYFATSLNNCDCQSGALKLSNHYVRSVSGKHHTVVIYLSLPMCNKKWMVRPVSVDPHGIKCQLNSWQNWVSFFAYQLQVNLELQFRPIQKKFPYPKHFIGHHVILFLLFPVFRFSYSNSSQFSFKKDSVHTWHVPC